MKPIWDIQTSISRRLLVWSLLSVSIGLVLVFLGNIFWKGFGIQAVVWGAIDAAIALAGILRTNRRRSVHDSPEQMSQEARKLKLQQLQAVAQLVMSLSVREHHKRKPLQRQALD